MPGVRQDRVGLSPASAASPASSEVKNDLRLVAIVAIGTALFFQTGLWGVFSWALGAPFHETGHTLAAWLVSRPAIPSPFRAIIFSEGRELWFFAAQLVGCALLWKRGREEGEESPLLIGLACVWAPLLVFCTFALRPESQEQLIAWAGQGGEIILPAAGIALALAYGSELPWVYGTSDTFLQQHRVLLFWGAVVFAASTTRWFLSLRNPTLVPFGGFGSEEGDLDVLKIDHMWTIAGFQRSYLSAAFLSAVGVFVVAALHWEGRNGGNR